MYYINIFINIIGLKMHIITLRQKYYDFVMYAECLNLYIFT